MLIIGLSSQIAVRAETVNVTVHRVGCNSWLSYKGYKITETLTESCSDVTMYHWSLYSVISISRRFNRGPFWCKFYLFAKCARVYETCKQCQWIIRTLSCKHKIWGGGGGNWLFLRPCWKAFPVFNVSETCREYFLTIDLWKLYQRQLSEG